MGFLSLRQGRLGSGTTRPSPLTLQHPLLPPCGQDPLGCWGHKPDVHTAPCQASSRLRCAHR